MKAMRNNLDIEKVEQPVSFPCIETTVSSEQERQRYKKKHLSVNIPDM